MKYALQRFVQFLIVFVLVTFAVLFVLRFGVGGPKEVARKMLGGQVADDSPSLQRVIKEYKLDSNIFVQYWTWVKNFVPWNFDMGFSEPLKTNVSTLLGSRAPVTIYLVFWSLLLALVIAVPFAVYSAYRRDLPFDRLGSLGSFVLLSFPSLVLGVLFKLFFVDKLKWFKGIGSTDVINPWNGIGAHFKEFFLPSLCLALPIAAVFARILRADLINTLQSDFITLAKAKGMSPQRILWRHALKNSLFSILTATGLQFGGLIGGTVVVEQLFQQKGLGSLLASQILASDFIVVQAIVPILIIAVVFINFFIDILYAVIDPRIRHMRALG